MSNSLEIVDGEIQAAEHELDEVENEQQALLANDLFDESVELTKDQLLKEVEDLRKNHEELLKKIETLEKKRAIIIENMYREQANEDNAEHQIFSDEYDFDLRNINPYICHIDLFGQQFV